jgi:putative colanic acid biosynthesis acetyltransferase WcaB
MTKCIFQDWQANAGNSKGRTILVLFRIASFISNSNKTIRLIGLPFIACYKIFICWIFGIELPLKSQVGHSLRLFHGQGLVVHEEVSIGSGVTLRHCTTIGIKGNKNHDVLVPVIGDNVDIGANSIVIGNIVIGNNVTIGAGSVVTKSISPNTTVVGNPARAI